MVPRRVRHAFCAAEMPELAAQKGRCVPKIPLVLEVVRICQACSVTPKSQCRRGVPLGVELYSPTRTLTIQASPRAAYASKATLQKIFPVGGVGFESYVLGISASPPLFSAPLTEAAPAPVALLPARPECRAAGRLGTARPGAYASVRPVRSGPTSGAKRPGRCKAG